MARFNGVRVPESATDVRGGRFGGEEVVEDEPVESFNAEDRVRQYATGFNEIVPNIVGAPVDIITALRRSADRWGFEGEIPEQIGGSDFLKRTVTDPIGMTASQEPETAFKKAGKFTSLGLSFSAGVKQLLGKDLNKIIQKAPKKVQVGPSQTTLKNIGGEMSRGLVTRPGATIAAEAAGSAGAAFGGHVAKETLGPEWEMVGEIVFGVPAALAGDLSFAFTKAQMPKVKLNAERTLGLDIEPGGIAGVTKKAYIGLKSAANSKVRAAKRIAEVSENPRAALEAMSKRRTIAGVKETSASKTGDKHLMALEQEFINDDPALFNIVQRQSGDNYELIKRELEGLYDEYPVSVAQAELTKDIDVQTTLLEMTLDKARSKIRVAAGLLEPGADRATINKITRRVIDDAAGKAKQHENQLWEQIDGTLRFSKQGQKALQKTYKDDLKDYLPDEDIPGIVKSWLGGKVDKRLDTLEGLKKLRSSVGSHITAEKSKPNVNWDKVRVLNNFREDILDHMRVIDNSDHLDTAIAFSREVNQKFRTGAVGKIRGYDPTGSGRIEPELTLEATVGAGGPKAGVVSRQLSDIQEVGGKRLLDEDPSGLVDSYMRARVKAVNSEGKVQIESVSNYIKNNELALNKFPVLKKQLSDLIELEKGYKELSQQVKKQLGSTELKFEQSLTGKGKGKLAATIFDQPDPEKAFNFTLSKLSPQGKKSLKGDMIYYLQKQAEGQPLEDGTRSLSGLDMRAAYTSQKELYNKAFSKPEIKRLNKIMDALTETKFPKDKMPKVEGGMSDIMASIFRIPSRMLGAKWGAKAMGNSSAGVSLQAAQIGASRGEKIFEKVYTDGAAKLMHDAVLDERLYKSLLQHAVKIKSATSKGLQMPEIPKHSPLKGWLIAAGFEELEEQ